MKTYSSQDVKRGEVTGFFGFAASILFALLLTWVSGCGDEFGKPHDSAPVVEISCDAPVDAPRCIVLAWNVMSVGAFYDGDLAWWDRDIAGDRRVSYMDAPGRVFLSVEACNATDCVVEWIDLR